MIMRTRAKCHLLSKTTVKIRNPRHLKITELCLCKNRASDDQTWMEKKLIRALNLSANYLLPIEAGREGVNEFRYIPTVDHTRL